MPIMGGECEWWTKRNTCDVMYLRQTDFLWLDERYER